MSEALITTSDLSVHFPLRGNLFGPRPVVRAVEGVTVDIERGSFFGLVGESGSGKTTLGRALLRAAPITRGAATYSDSEVTYDLPSLKGDELKDYRKRAHHLRWPEKVPSQWKVNRQIAGGNECLTHAGAPSFSARRHAT